MPVIIYLNSWTGVQHDVFDRALNILSPGHQPRHLVVMTHLLPLRPGRWFRMFWVPTMRSIGLQKKISADGLMLHCDDCSLLAAVNDNVLRSDTTLQHAHFRMVTSATEQAWRLNTEVGNALFVIVHNTEAILLQKALILLFDFL